MRRLLACVAWVLLLLAAAPIARAQDASSLGTPEVYANLEAAGVRVNVTGDADRDARLGLEVRRAGDAAWQPAHPLARIDATRFAGSLFFLSPATAYEARLTLDDPDNDQAETATAGFTTRPDGVALPPRPIHLYVDPERG
ncbi:MAG TPA: hypothetical protein P5076_15595, partial [Myxococcota bacterium]|nr:hypothetical protein [Myxococcota bacterium]